MPKRTDLNTILIIGAGPIVIGQAAEFDYSGSQAVKALKAEGYRVIVVNSNPATIMTDPELADVTYIEPITHFTYFGFEWVRPWPGEWMLTLPGLRTSPSTVTRLLLYSLTETITLGSVRMRFSIRYGVLPSDRVPSRISDSGGIRPPCCACVALQHPRKGPGRQGKPHHRRQQ